MLQCANDGPTLSICARVSRALSEHALEVLWEEQEGIASLFMLLPQSVRCISGQDEGTQFVRKHYVSSTF